MVDVVASRRDRRTERAAWNAPLQPVRVLQQGLVQRQHGVGVGEVDGVFAPRARADERFERGTTREERRDVVPGAKSVARMHSSTQALGGVRCAPKYFSLR